ncbi:MAG: alpha/beta fold hydrolase [Phycisphaerae bacterium]
MISINSTQLHCDSFGDGPPLLLVHGFPLTGEMWHGVSLRLAHRWRCIIPDLRGHGRSPAIAEVSIARFSDDLAELLDALGESRPVVLIGLSMGGIIGFEFFRRYRARLRALVLTCTRANSESPEGAARREAVAEAVLREGSRAAVDAMIENVFAPGTPTPLRAYWHSVMCACPPFGVAAAARALAGRADSRPTLPQIDIPTLVIAGARDSITPVDTLREIHAGIRGSRLEIIESAGHVPPIEASAEFARILAEFLDALPA